METLRQRGRNADSGGGGPEGAPPETAGAGEPRFPAQGSPGMVSRFSTMCEAKARAGTSRSGEEGAAGAASKRTQLLGAGAGGEEGCEGAGEACARASRGPSRTALRGRDRAGILPDGNALGEGHKAVTSVCEELQGQSTEVEEG